MLTTTPADVNCSTCEQAAVVRTDDGIRLCARCAHSHLLLLAFTAAADEALATGDTRTARWFLDLAGQEADRLDRKAA